MEGLNLDASSLVLWGCRNCGSPAGEETDPFCCGGCYLKAILLIRHLLSQRKSLRRKVRVLKDISGMLQHRDRIKTV